MSNIILVCCWNSHDPNCLKFKMMASKIIIEAVAWVTKYFVAASVDRGFFLLIRRGVIDNKLSSSPTHMSRRLVLDIVMTGPIRIVR